MKLKNKKTGEIVNAKKVDLYTDDIYLEISKDGRYETRVYNSLAKLNEEWEDYKELVSDYWYIATEVDCGLDIVSSCECSVCKKCRDFNNSIGNLFKTKEEAMRAVEKLKALKRLEDKGFRFDGWTIDDLFKISICTNFEGDNIYSESEKEIRDALDLLFGGEE